MVRRADVAALAGTSPAVVSYVVNGGPRPVAAGTRARVEAAIAQLGYRPNGLAKALRSQRTNALGLIVPDNSNPFFAEAARTIEEAAYARGFILLLGNSTDRADREARYVHAFLDRRVDGLLLISAGGGGPTRAALAGTSTPVVFVDRKPRGVDGSVVQVDNIGGAFTATAHLLSHGYESVGLLHGGTGLVSLSDRAKGWHRAMAAAPARVGPQIRSALTKADAYAAGLAVLRRPDRPRAMFCTSDQQAVGLLRAAHDVGLRVPEDLALASFDGVPDAQFNNPSLTTIVQPTVELADEALRLLLDEPSDRIRRTTLPVVLQIGRSCGCSGDRPAAPAPRSQRARRRPPSPAHPWKETP